MKYNYLSFRDAVFVSTADTMEYVIKCGQEYIFRGIAVKAPGEDNAIINVGDICTQYLDNQMPDFRDFDDVVTKQRNAFRKFTLFRVERTIIWTGPETFIDDVTEHAEAIYNFLYCWDYDDFTWDNEDAVLSDPVNGHLDCRMKILYTQYGETTGATFYVTPILSARPDGSTVTADILTEYDDPSLLEVRIGNSSITIDSVSLTGATYTTPENNGDTYTTMADYYYDGEWVGQTQIVIAGYNGGDVPPEPPVAWDGNIYINGYGNWRTYFAARNGIVAYIRLDSSIYSGHNYTVSVTGSEHITGGTRHVTVSDTHGNTWEEVNWQYIDLELIDSGTPAEIGEQVLVQIEKNGAVTSITATVVTTNSGLTNDYRASSWYSVELTDTGETPYAVADAYNDKTWSVDHKATTTSFNGVMFGQPVGTYDDRDYHIVHIVGYQLFPGGYVVNGISPFTVTSETTNGVKTMTFTSPFPMNGLTINDYGGGGYTSIADVQSSVLDGIRVIKTHPQSETRSFTCSSYSNQISKVTVPITMYKFRRLETKNAYEPGFADKGVIKYGYRTSDVKCLDGRSVTVQTSDSLTANWDLYTNTL